MNSCWMNKTPTWFNGPLLKFEAYWVQEILNSLAQSTLSSFSSTIFQGLIQSLTPLKLAPSPIPTPKVLSPPSVHPWNISALWNKLACCLTSPIPQEGLRTGFKMESFVYQASTRHPPGLRKYFSESKGSFHSITICQSLCARHWEYRGDYDMMAKNDENKR